jgi:hypothetical protein
MTSLEFMMRQWLTDPDPMRRAHATHRLTLPFDDEPPAPAAPPLLTRAVNFAGAVFGHVAAGMPQADPATVAARLAVCGGCERFIAPNSCAVCGCNLSAKASWLDSACPLDKWPKPI